MKKETKAKSAATTILLIIFLVGVVIGDYLDLDFLSKDEPKYDMALIARRSYISSVALTGVMYSAILSTGHCCGSNSPETSFAILTLSKR